MYKGTYKLVGQELSMFSRKLEAHLDIKMYLMIGSSNPRFGR